MELTHRQERLIARYLNDVGDEVGDVSDALRERLLRRLKLRIYRQLRECGHSSVQDEDVDSVLARLGNPAGVAMELLHAKGGAAGLVLSADDRRWLGVCGGLAEYLGVESGTVRLIAVVLGLCIPGISGPIVLAAYLILYFEMYFASTGLDVPRIDKARVASYTLGTLAAAVAFDIGARLVLAGSAKAYVRLMEAEALPLLGRWDWLRYEAPFLLFCVLALLTPIAVLSGLPLANKWDQTGKRVVQAGLALYALILSFGIASFLVGLIVHAVESFVG